MGNSAGEPDTNQCQTLCVRKRSQFGLIDVGPIVVDVVDRRCDARHVCGHGALGTSVWWGYGLLPDREGNYVKKRMDQCTGREILTELLQHLKFATSSAIMLSSICISCNMPYVNNIWLPRRRGDRPPVFPEGMTNLGVIGQYVELEQDIAFTFEYSTRTAWEAIYRLLKRAAAPPRVYQGHFDPKGVWAILKVFLGLAS
jgi:oleate hydratase